MLSFAEASSWVCPSDRQYFTNTAVVVTGGAQGIGRAISLTYCVAGANVLILDPDAEAGADFVAWAKAFGYDVDYVQGSVANPNDVERLAAALRCTELPLRCLVNNAGISSPGNITSRPLPEWDHVLNVNLRGPYLMTAKILQLWDTRGGSIINISSTRALMSEPNTEPYSASKGGVLALTHSLAMSLADRNIRVNCISPGWIATDDWQKPSRRHTPHLTPTDHQQHPVGRVGSPEDIARACLFLSGSGAGFITGVNLVVDGGMTIKMIYVE